MHLYKAKSEQCAPCKKLAEYIDKKAIEVPTTTINFDDLRAGQYPFRTVPTLVLDDGSFIQGFAPIRLYLSKR